MEYSIKKIQLNKVLGFVIIISLLTGLAHALFTLLLAITSQSFNYSLLILLLVYPAYWLIVNIIVTASLTIIYNLWAKKFGGLKIWLELNN